MSLRNKLIKLAYQKPEMREHLLPLIEGQRTATEDKEAKSFKSPEALREYLKKHPKSDRSKHRVEKPQGKGKEQPKEKGKDQAKPKKRKPLSDVSKQKGFESLKGMSPEKQREVVQRALEMGKPKKDRKPVQKDVSDKPGFSALKGLSPEDQKKVLQRALKMAMEE